MILDGAGEGREIRVGRDARDDGSRVRTRVEVLLIHVQAPPRRVVGTELNVAAESNAIEGVVVVFVDVVVVGLEVPRGDRGVHRRGDEGRESVRVDGIDRREGEYRAGVRVGEARDHLHAEPGVVVGIRRRVGTRGNWALGGPSRPPRRREPRRERDDGREA